jgi:hypothetical protein
MGSIGVKLRKFHSCRMSMVDWENVRENPQFLKRNSRGIDVHKGECEQLGTLKMHVRAQRDLSDGVNRSSNGAFMRKLRHKQWRVNFKTHLTSKSHNFLLRDQIEVQE